MLQNYKKSKEGQKGFTIVELLIVIVVIAILAAITIVAYNGVTTSARSSKAKQHAQNAQSVAEAFNAEVGRYPGTILEIKTGGAANPNGAAKIPSGMDVIGGPAGAGPTAAFTPALTAANGETTVAYSYVGASATTATGGVIVYWDFANASTTNNYIYVGTASVTSTFVKAL